MVTSNQRGLVRRIELLEQASTMGDDAELQAFMESASDDELSRFRGWLDPTPEAPAQARRAAAEMSDMELTRILRPSLERFRAYERAQFASEDELRA